LDILSIFIQRNLGYNTYFVETENFEEEIKKIKNKAKNINSKKEFDTIEVDRVYKCLIEESLICSKVSIPGLEGEEVVIEKNVMEIRIPFSDRSKKFNKKMIEQILYKKFTFGIEQYDYDQLIFEDNNNLYIDYYGQIYKVKDKNKFLKIFGEYIK
jgi:hypothetical protein